MQRFQVVGSCPCRDNIALLRIQLQVMPPPPNCNFQEVCAFARLAGLLSRSSDQFRVSQLHPPMARADADNVGIGHGRYVARSREFSEDVSQGNAIAEEFVRAADERPSVLHSSFSKSIPVIDLARLDQDRAQVVLEVGRACKDWGLFQIVNHGVAKAVIQNLEDKVNQFFSLPIDEKLKYRQESGTFFGYNKGSFLQDDAILDWRELIAHRCLPLSQRDTHTWPNHPPGYREAIFDYSQEMTKVMSTLLQLITESLLLPSTTLIDRFKGNDAEQKLLCNYYPACPRPDLTLGLKRHTDPGLITVLLQDKVGGLQAFKDGEGWQTVEPIDSALVVNLGDQMHVLTNGLYRSAYHQAVVNSKCARLSIACFFSPAPTSMIAPLPQLVDPPTRPAISKPYVFRDFYQVKMRQHQEKDRESREASSSIAR